MRGGHVDAISRRVVAGWAADPDLPGHRLTVSISVDGQPYGNAVADRLRNDLASLGRYGDGRHGFSFTFPEPLSAHQDHVVVVVFDDDGAKLPNGEQRIAAAGAAVSEKPNIAGSGGPKAAPAKPPGERPAGEKTPAEKPAAGAQAAGKPAAARPADPQPGSAKAQAAAPATPSATSAAAAGLTPILVTAPGRSGTTLLMGLLARSPHIVAAELVPYELRLISYHAAAFNVLTAPADLDRSTHPDRLEGDGFHIGFNPFHSPQYAHAFRHAAPVRDYFDEVVPAQVGACARDLIRDFYQRLATDRGKPAVRFLAEKGNNLHKPTRMFARRAFGAVRELVIVRDPRDVLCSHMAYFSSSPEKAFTQLSHAVRLLMAIRAEPPADIHFLKYEEMVRGDPACFAAISKFLGTTIEPEAGEAGAKVFAKHATSVSPEASVARWRINLPNDLKQRCAADWAAFLAEFGYATV